MKRKALRRNKSATPQPRRAGQATTTKQTAGLLASLGLYGLDHLDAVVLAALAAETPMLLIGPHGSAKSALLERLAVAMDLEHRHYNASLLSFDDLLGFPVPDGEGLKYLQTPATLWGAQSVFLDEISRCRPEVQNKLYSIVHEKRVQGIALEALRHRWAAMNPPATSDTTDEIEGTDVYTGSLPLDPALADRFGFVLNLPALEELSPEARREVIRSGLGPATNQATAIDIRDLVSRCRKGAEFCASLHGDWITAYTSTLVVPLRQANLGISGRRAAMLAANIAAVHGARRVLTKSEPDTRDDTHDSIVDSALVALRHSLPHRAQGKPVDAGVVATLHRQAVDSASQSLVDTELVRILEEAHPVRRIGMALATLKADSRRIPRHTMSVLVADALAAQHEQARWILAQELLPTLVTLDCVDAATLELLAGPFMAQVAFEERKNLRHELPRSQIAPFNDLVAAVSTLDTDDPGQVALGNLATALYTQDESASDPAALKRQQSQLRTCLEAKDTHAY